MKLKNSFYYMTAGVVIGCLAMSIYLFPSFYAGLVNSSIFGDEPIVKTKGAVQAASSGDWSEDWSVGQWRVARLVITTRVNNSFILYPQKPDGACERKSGCLGEPWVTTETANSPECACIRAAGAEVSDPIALGPSVLKVTGEVDGKSFTETWTAGGWMDTDYDVDAKVKMNDWMARGDTFGASQNIFVTFENKNSNFQTDAILFSHPDAPDNTERIFYPIGEYGYSSARWKESNFTGKGAIDGGRSMPTTWHVEGSFN